MVGAAPTPALSPIVGSFHGQISLARGLIYEAMGSSEGVRVQLNTLRSNRNTVRSISGTS